MQIENEKFKAEIRNDGVMLVWYKEPPVVTESQLHPDGSVKVSQHTTGDPNPSMAKLLEGLSKMPYFATAYGGNGTWLCDIDAGFQRCKKNASGVVIGKALRGCGFSYNETRRLMRRCKKQTHNYLPWRA